MKQGTRLALLLAAVLVYAAVYLRLPQDSPRETPAPATDTPVRSISREDITALSWDYAIRTLRFQRADAGWEYSDDEHFPMDQGSARFAALLDAVAGLTYSRYLPEVTDPAEYGLDAPVTVITVTCGDGETVLTVGAQNSVTGAYYLQVSGDDGVYLIDGTLPSAFACGLFDLVQTDDIPDLSSAMELRASSRSYHKNEQGQWCDSKNTALETDLTGLLTALDYDACIDYYAERYEMKDEEYGLTHGKTVSVTYGPADAPEVWQLVIGNDYDDSHVIVSPADSDLVYTMDRAVVETLLQP